MVTLELGSIADWVSGIGTLLAVLFVVVQMFFDKKHRRESLRSSNMAKYRKEDAKLIKIRDVEVYYFNFSIEYISGEFSPYTCILLETNINGVEQYFRSEIVSYLKSDKLFEFCLPKKENLELKNIYIISKDENNITYVKKHKWIGGYGDAIFEMSEVFTKENNKFENILKYSTVIDQRLDPCRNIIEHFNVINDFYNQTDWGKQKVNSSELFNESEISAKIIKQLLNQNPQIFKKSKVNHIFNKRLF
ncbi:hypothetical protein RU86_GL000557 [Lactococcus piscium]|uniref:Uncharacterized protein n=1 Tax=Pseudolactococcus piscium TaxID=1364 RepID=A0A2A5RX50_9LACT|nr:hypothetical protein [Lactococcus piscium]PCS05802.1 hypothetical protein RU86_GL000557 [Lactococcus piscium]